MRGDSKKFLANAEGNAEAPSSSLASATLARVAANDPMSGPTTLPATHQPAAHQPSRTPAADNRATTLPASTRPAEAAWWEEIVRLREESVGVGTTTATGTTPALAAAATVDMSVSAASPAVQPQGTAAEPTPPRGGRRGRPRQQEAAAAAAAESMAQLRDAEARLETTERLALGYIERQRTLILHLQNGMVNANTMLKVALAEKWTGELLVQPDLETPAWLQSLKDRAEREAREKLQL